MPSRKPLKRVAVKSAGKVVAARKTVSKPVVKPAKRRLTLRSPARTPFAEPPMTERLPGTVAPLTPIQITPIPQTEPVAPAAAKPPPQQAIPEVTHPETKAPSAVEKAGISGEELYKRIQFDAYLLGERDGFKADPVHYWIQAERAVKKSLRG